MADKEEGDGGVEGRGLLEEEGDVRVLEGPGGDAARVRFEARLAEACERREGQLARAGDGRVCTRPWTGA